MTDSKERISAADRGEAYRRANRKERALVDAGGDNEDDEEARDVLQILASCAVIGIFMLMAIGAIYTLSGVLIPLTLAIVVGLILGVLADKLGALGVPSAVTAVVLTSAIGAALFFTVSALSTPLSSMTEDLPKMIERTVERMLPFIEKLPFLKLPHDGATEAMSVDSMLEKSGTILQMVLGGLTPALVQGLIFFAALVLFLAGRLRLRRTLILVFPGRERRLTTIRIITAIERALGFYFATASILYVAVGIMVTAIAWFGGFPQPWLWGFFAFLASFVPFLGFATVTAALTAAGLMIHDGLFAALAPATVFLIVHMVMENLVFPAVMGRRLEMNPFIVFIAIIFWTWLWGAVGAMLALPLLLMGMTVITELFPSSRLQPNLPG